MEDAEDGNQIQEPTVYQAVRAVGKLRPKFNPTNGKLFSEDLNVTGTAFWLKDYRVLVTCAHVISDLISAPIELAGLLVVGNAGNYKRAFIDTVDWQHDLATLRLIGENGQPLDREELEKEASVGLEISPSYYKVSTKVAYCGFPFGNQFVDKLHSPTYVEGVIGVSKRQDGRRKNIQISGPVVGGLSGAPIVLRNKPSILIGILSNSPSQAAAPANIFMGTSWEHIKALAELVNS